MQNEIEMYVTLKARFVSHDESRGEVVVTVPGVEIQARQRDVLQELFPDLGGAVELLLMKQALLQVVR